MSLDVDRILAERAGRASRAPEATSVAAALLLHAVVLGGAFLLPRLTPPPPPLNFVPVQIIPAQALGVRRPAPPRRAEPPAPKPVEEPAQEPAPAPEPEPEPEKPAPPAPKEEAPVLPAPDKKPEKKPEPAKKPAPAASSPKADPKPTPKPSTRPEPPASAPDKPAGTATGETGDQLGRRGGAQGNPLGTTAFGSEIAGVDNPDFTFGYYLDRLLSLIDGQWQRPNMGSGVKTVLSFRIERDGTLSDLKIAESSGYNSFDLAAMRAVTNASPFPPLPRAYRHDSLGVNLIVR